MLTKQTQDWLNEVFDVLFPQRGSRIEAYFISSLTNLTSIQGWAKEWALGCVIPASWLPLTAEESSRNLGTTLSPLPVHEIIFIRKWVKYRSYDHWLTLSSYKIVSATEGLSGVRSDNHGFSQKCMCGESVFGEHHTSGHVGGQKKGDSPSTCIVVSWRLFGVTTRLGNKVCWFY